LSSDSPDIDVFSCRYQATAVIPLPTSKSLPTAGLYATISIHQFCSITTEWHSSIAKVLLCAEDFQEGKIEAILFCLSEFNLFYVYLVYLMTLSVFHNI
jgi:hypothetical protein